MTIGIEDIKPSVPCVPCVKKGVKSLDSHCLFVRATNIKVNIVIIRATTNALLNFPSEDTLRMFKTKTNIIDIKASGICIFDSSGNPTLK